MLFLREYNDELHIRFPFPAHQHSVGPLGGEARGHGVEAAEPVCLRRIPRAENAADGDPHQR